MISMWFIFRPKVYDFDWFTQDALPVGYYEDATPEVREKLDRAFRALSLLGQREVT